MKNQEFEAADADLTRAIELNANDGYAHFYRWETRNRLNQYMDAVKDAHRALDIDNSTFYPHIFGTHRCDVNGCGSVDNHIEPHRHVVTLPEDHHKLPSQLPEH